MASNFWFLTTFWPFLHLQGQLVLLYLAERALCISISSFLLKHGLFELDLQLDCSLLTKVHLVAHLYFAIFVCIFKFSCSIKALEDPISLPFLFFNLFFVLFNLLQESLKAHTFEHNLIFLCY